MSFAPRLCCGLLLALAPALLHAQRGGGAPGGGRPGGMGGGPQGSGFPGMSGGAGGSRPNAGGLPSAGANGATSTMRGGLQLGPPGRWWDDKSFVTAIGLRKDQQKRMDGVFNANKSSILENYKSLLREEAKLEATVREPQLDKAKIFAGIDAVNQARAGLEKANAQMLLQIRQEMDADQLARMDKFRDKPSDESAN